MRLQILPHTTTHRNAASLFCLFLMYFTAQPPSARLRERKKITKCAICIRTFSKLKFIKELLYFPLIKNVTPPHASLFRMLSSFLGTFGYQKMVRFLTAILLPQQVSKVMDFASWCYLPSWLSWLKLKSECY